MINIKIYNFDKSEVLTALNDFENLKVNLELQNGGKASFDISVDQSKVTIANFKKYNRVIIKDGDDFIFSGYISSWRYSSESESKITVNLLSSENLLSKRNTGSAEAVSGNLGDSILSVFGSYGSGFGLSAGTNDTTEEGALEFEREDVLSAIQKMANQGEIEFYLDKDDQLQIRKYQGDNGLMKNMVSYLAFDEGEGDVSYDKIGINNVELKNGPTWVNGRRGKAIHFNRSDTQYLQGNGPMMTDNFTEATICGFTKFEDFEGAMTIMNQFFGNSSDRLLYNNTSKLLRFSADLDSVTSYCDIADFDDKYDIGDWFFWVIRLDATGATLGNGIEMKIFLSDGNTYTGINATTGTEFTVDTSVLYIGGVGGPAHNLTGIIDNIMLFDTILTDDEIESVKMSILFRKLRLNENQNNINNILRVDLLSDGTPIVNKIVGTSDALVQTSESFIQEPLLETVISFSEAKTNDDLKLLVDSELKKREQERLIINAMIDNDKIDPYSLSLGEFIGMNLKKGTLLNIDTLFRITSINYDYGDTKTPKVTVGLADSKSKALSPSIGRDIRKIQERVSILENN